MKKKIRRFRYTTLTLLFCFFTLSVSYESTVAAPQSYLPIPGDWLGDTSQGNPVSFEVMDSRTHLKSFYLTYDLDCGGTIETETYAFISIGDGMEIIDNQILLSAEGRTFTGTFTSDETSTGTFDVAFFNINIGDFCDAAGNWSATPELAWHFQMFQPLFLGSGS